MMSHYIISQSAHHPGKVTHFAVSTFKMCCFTFSWSGELNPVHPQAIGMAASHDAKIYGRKIMDLHPPHCIILYVMVHQARARWVFPSLSADGGSYNGTKCEFDYVVRESARWVYKSHDLYMIFVI